MIWGGRDVSPLTIEEATLRSRTRGRNIKPLVIITKTNHQSCFVLDVSTVLVSEMLSGLGGFGRQSALEQECSDWSKITRGCSTKQIACRRYSKGGQNIAMYCVIGIEDVAAKFAPFRQDNHQRHASDKARLNARLILIQKQQTHVVPLATE